MALKKRYGLTLIIIEHILKVVMETCDTGHRAGARGEDRGRPARDEIKDNHRVIEAYLGKEMDDAEVRAFPEGVVSQRGSRQRGPRAMPFEQPRVVIVGGGAMGGLFGGLLAGGGLDVTSSTPGAST